MSRLTPRGSPWGWLFAALLVLGLCALPALSGTAAAGPRDAIAVHAVAATIPATEPGDPGDDPDADRAGAAGSQDTGAKADKKKKKKKKSAWVPIVTEVVTHIIAFLIFVWILARFAWKPLLKVIDERRTKIESDFDRAEALQKKAEETQEKYEAQLRKIEDEARDKMHEAIEEGRRIANEIQAKAREDAEQLLERAKANTEIELANARKQLRKDVVELTMSVTEKVLREKIDRAAHARYVDGFIDDLGGLS